MREEFLPTEGVRARFRRNILSMRPRAGDYGNLSAPLLIGRQAAPEWDSLWKTPDGGGLDDAAKADMTLLVQLKADILLEAANSAEALLEYALLQYWESDRGLRFLARQDGVVPENYYRPKGGVYNRCFEAMGGGWKVAVNFDTADYIILNDQLLEVNRLKKELYRDLVDVATQSRAVGGSSSGETSGK